MKKLTIYNLIKYKYMYSNNNNNNNNNLCCTLEK